MRRRARNAALRTIGLGLAGIAVAAVLLWIAFQSSHGIPWRSYYTVHAQFRDLANLPPLGAEVRIAGKRAGRVFNPRVRDGVAQVDLQLDSDVARLPIDTTARIRPRGLLGVQYVDVNPGRARRVLPDGGTITVARTSQSVQLSQVLSAFDSRRRRELRATLDTLGAGLLGRGAGLNESLAHAPQLLRDTRALSDAVLARRGAAERFFGSLESAAGAAAPVHEDIARGFEPAQRALRPFAQQRPSVRRLLDEAPPALAAVRAGLARGDGLLDETTRFARSTTRLTSVAPAALDEAQRLLHESERPLRSTRELLLRARSAVPVLLRLTDRIDPVLPASREALADNLPLLRELGPRRCDMLGYWSNWRSMLSFAPPQTGPLGAATVLRFELLGSRESLGGTRPGAPPVKGTDAYPAPCHSVTEGRQ